MKRTPDEIYKRIDNKIYTTEGDRWWQTDFSLNLIRTFINPVRSGYINRKIREFLKTDPEKLTVLEVGCGGGLLSEEIAGMGYRTTGIDPSYTSIETAIRHAGQSNLNINYKHGSGENIPFPDSSFDVILCCDVLEHVRDLPNVISEISRVLKPGGLFVYDTFDRTLISKICIIYILQEWSFCSIMPRGLHVWKMFIKPSEIRALLNENSLQWQDHTGVKPDISYLKMFIYLRQRAAGKLNYEQFGTKFKMVEGGFSGMMYMGCAVKKG